MIDYHDMCNIDTPQDERRAKNIGDIWINAATCNNCGSYIRSKNRHDFVTCECGAVSVDGGSWYAKRTFDATSVGGYTDEIIMFEDVDGETT